MKTVNMSSLSVLYDQTVVHSVRELNLLSSVAMYYVVWSVRTENTSRLYIIRQTLCIRKEMGIKHCQCEHRAAVDTPGLRDLNSDASSAVVL